jgi:MFS family permease
MMKGESETGLQDVQIVDGRGPDARAPETYSLDEALDTFGLAKFQYLIIAIGGLAYTADAMEIMVLSFLGPIMKCQYRIGGEEEASMTTVVFIGMCIGAWLFGNVADAYGRKMGALSTAVLCSFGGVASAMVSSYSALILVRFLVGLGMGGVPVAYSWVMEFVPAKGRGKVGVVVQLFWTFGAIFQSLVAWGTLSSAGWRWMLILTAVPLFVMLGMFGFVPESPRYLLAKGRVQEAEAILVRISKYNKTALPTGRLRASNGANAPVKKKMSLQEQFRAAFSPENKRDTALLMVIWFSCACLYYGTVLLTTELIVVKKGHHPEATLTNSTTSADTSDREIVCSGVFNDSDFRQILFSAFGELPGMLTTFFLVDRIGRRLSMTIMFSASTVLIILLSILLESDTAASLILFLMRAIFIGTFTIVYIYTPERYPTNIRSSVMGSLVAFSRFGGMLSPHISQAAPDAGAVWVPFVVYTLLSFAAAVASYKLSVETAGKNLDDVEPDEGVQLSVTKRKNKDDRAFQMLRET